MEFKITYPSTGFYEIYLYDVMVDDHDYNVSTGRIECSFAIIECSFAIALETAKKMMEKHNFIDADIVDATTGEVVASVVAVQNDDHERIAERCSGCAYNVERDGVSCCDIDGSPIFSIDHCEAMEDDEPDEDFDCEIGYNPYLGCFDFDC